jgi:hypothetical protein
VTRQKESKVALIRLLFRTDSAAAYSTLVDCSVADHPLCVPALRLRLFQLEMTRKALDTKRTAAYAKVQLLGGGGKGLW